MRKAVYLFLLTTFFVSITSLSAQNYSKIDSLKKVLNTLSPLNGTEADTMRLKISIEIGKLYLNTKPDSTLFLLASIIDTVSSDTKIKETPRRSYLNASAIRILGYAYFIQSNYSKAIAFYKKSLDISTSLRDSISIYRCLIQIGDILSDKGDYAIAIEYYIQSLKICEELGDKNGISKCLTNLGIVSWYQGDLRQAIFYYNKSLKTCEELGDKNGIAACLMNLSAVIARQGDYPKATEYYEKVLKINEELGNKSDISKCLTNLGIVSWLQGDYNKATIYYEKALKIREDLGDKIGIANLRMNLGIVYTDQGDYSKAIEFHEKALKIFFELDNKRGISDCMKSFGYVFYYQGDYLRAQSYCDKSLKIFEELGDKNGISDCFLDLGALFYVQGDYSKATIYYEKSIKIKEELGTLADLADFYLNLADVYAKKQKYDKAATVYLKAVCMKRKIIQDNFSVLSEKEKGDFLEKTGKIFNTLNEFASITKSDSIIAQCYNNTLLLKGLLLQSSRSVIEVVNKSADTTMVNTYWRFIKLRAVIAEKYSTPINERKANLDSLENRANTEERNLVLLSKDYSEIQKQYNYKWEDVQTALKKDEAAIEFVKINCDLLLKQTPVKIDTIKNNKGIRDSVVYKKEKNDSTFYAAFIVRPEYKSPKMVSLFDEKQLESILNKMVNNRGIKILDQPVTKEKSRELYDLIWLLLENELKGVKTIYYSPVGLLYKVSFAALTSPEKKFLFDEYNLKELNCTREIFSQNKPMQINSDFICSIYGGIQYDLDANKLIASANKYKFDDKIEIIAANDKTQTKDIKRGGEWNYLKGTLLEAETIQQEFQKRKITTNFFSGENAIEESFKSLSSKSPTIIHIATHGFYIANNVNKNTDLEAGNNFKFNKNPLFRSGLIMAGANRVWTGNDAIDGVDDGILTAFEVSNLDLSNTKLVVLSACETGLGEIRGSEGVYGLQRAFKMAGVQYIIMTLWEIRDEVTVEFMGTFYKQWLNGKDIYAAFKYAQDEMRKKYEANYWAAFVLVK